MLWVAQDMQLASCVQHEGTGKMTADEQCTQLILRAFSLAEPCGAKLAEVLQFRRGTCCFNAMHNATDQAGSTCPMMRGLLAAAMMYV